MIVAMLIVCIPVVLAFFLGYIFSRMQQLPKAVLIPVAALVKEKKIKGIPSHRKSLPVPQIKEWRDALGTFLHQRFPLTTEQLARLVPKIEELILAEVHPKD